MPDLFSGNKRWLADVGAEIRTAAVRARQWIAGRPVLELVAPLTLVLLILYPVGHQDVQVWLQLGGVAGLLYRPLQRAPLFWILLAAAMALGCILTWEDADNHKYLITYWCLAVGLSCAAEDTAKALRVNARLLLGLCFLLAVAWKVRAPDFVTGEYYQFSMLTDDRLFSVGQLFSGMTPEVYFQNQQAVDRLTAWSSSLEQVALDGAPQLRPLSRLLVGWTLLVESWIFISFLWPSTSIWNIRSRHASLLVFVATTYAAAHVGGFAWILTILGLAQVRAEHGRWRLAYLGALALVILYQLDPIDALLVWLEG